LAGGANKISVSCRPRAKVPQQTYIFRFIWKRQVFLLQYFVYSGGIYTTPQNTGWSMDKSKNKW
jgi:hypothetical protein